MPLRNFPTPGVRDGRTNQEQTAGDSDRSDGWAGFTGIFRSSSGPLPQPWGELFGPLRAGAVDDLVVVGQIGQSIDGRIATESGHSKYINGPAGLDHLHRLRALVDAVVIGVGTALADDPRLTVRRFAGPQPARVVIDPNGRLPAPGFAGDGVRRLLITAPERAARRRPGGHSGFAPPMGASRRRRSLPRWPGAAFAAC